VNNHAFVALKADGSIKAWGSQHRGGENAPKGGGYTQIYSTKGAFAPPKTDGSIKGWGLESSLAHVVFTA
jgi:hypothetical protein